MPGLTDFAAAMKKPLDLRARKPRPADDAIAAQGKRDAAWRAEAKRALTRGVPKAYDDAKHWLLDPGPADNRSVGSSVRDAASEVGGLAVKALRSVADAGGQLRHGRGPIAEAAKQAWAHPAEAADTAATFIPGVGSAKTFNDAVSQAAQYRQAGLGDAADMLSELAVPMSALTLATDGTGSLAARAGYRVLGKGAAHDAEHAAARAAYDVANEQPFKVVARRGVENDIVRMPEAANASLPELRALAQDRTRSPAILRADQHSLAVRGVPYDERAPIPRSSLQRQAGIGRAYREAATNNPDYQHAVFERWGEMYPQIVEQAKAQNYNQLTEAAYRSLGDEVGRQFDSLPVRTRYHSGPGEYASSPDMIRDVLGNGNLNVFSGGDPHEFLSRIDPATGLSQNEMFRAVHDYYGHVLPGSMFGPQGEEAAYAAHSQMLSPLSQLALLSETRGQNSLVNYSPLNADLIGVKNRLRRMGQERALGERYLAANPGDTHNGPEIRKALEQIPDPQDILRQQAELGGRFTYAPQKAVLLPPEHLDAMSPGGTPDWLRPVLSGKSPTEARGVHFSNQAQLDATDPSFFGTGHKGQEYPMVRRQGRPERTYFYSGPEGSVEAENEVARKTKGVYEAPLSNLYDINADPEGLVDLAKAHNLSDYRQMLPYNVAHSQFEGDSLIPDLERLVKDYGYSGYLSNYGGQRAAAVYDPVENLRYLGSDPTRGYAAGGLV